MFAEKVNKICSIYHDAETTREAEGHTVSASWAFVCDGLNTHKLESLVWFVVEQCCVEEELGREGKDGIFKSQASYADFFYDKNHRIRFVYTPKHCSWMDQIEIWFEIIKCRLLKRKSYQSVQQLEESILCFIK